MNIGLKIKTLRAQIKMTQEDLAELLNVSAKAVSRWENNITFPSITLLPILANIFDITVDELLDLDVLKKEEEISKIKEEDEMLANIGDTKLRIKKLRAGLKKFPNSFELMERLANALFGFYCAKDKERDYILKELIPLCERIISKCSDLEIKASATQILCSSYCFKKQYDKAKRLADKMPGFYSCKEMLLDDILQGEELNNLLNENIVKCSEWIRISISKKIRLTKDNIEKIKLHEKYIKFMETIYEQEDYGFYNLRL